MSSPAQTLPPIRDNENPSEGHRMSLRYIDWIWHVRGNIPLAPGQSSDEAFERLDPLFYEVGTSHEWAINSLTFNKKDPGAQDKMSVFDRGDMRIEETPAGSVLRYHLISRALLYCFLAPLLFIAFAQFTIAINKLNAPAEETAGTSEKTPDDTKKDKKPKADVPMNPIDKFLGAPAPDKKDEKKDKGDGEGGGKQPSPTPAYVFAGIFAFLYLVGRILEDRLVKSLFRKTLTAP